MLPIFLCLLVNNYILKDLQYKMYYCINFGCWPQAIILSLNAAKYHHDNLVEVTVQHDVRSGPDVRVVRMLFYPFSFSHNKENFSKEIVGFIGARRKINVCMHVPTCSRMYVGTYCIVLYCIVMELEKPQY
jgi:hypothetical protein